MITFNINADFQGEVLYDVSLKEKTTFKIGGKADLLIIPKNEHSLALAVSELKKQNIPWFILGGGSNVVISDDGIKGAVISTQGINSIEHDYELNTNYVLLNCGAGATIEQVTKYCIENSLTGLEHFAGLPGTVGGAVYMNARCYDTSISDVLEEVGFFENDNVYFQKINKDDESFADDWAYKKSPYQQHLFKLVSCADRSVITRATFKVSEGDSKKIRELCEHYIEDRKQKGHFKFPSAGSVFKNNRAFGIPSGKIIDEVGLRGFSIGDAQVAQWHGNFIINKGNASAREIKQLVEHIQKEVQKSKGFYLEPEILFIES